MPGRGGGVAGTRSRAGRRLPWRGDAKITANLAGEEIVYLSMARDGGSCILFGVVENGVAGTFAEQLAALLGKVPQKLTTLHRPGSDPYGDGLSPRIAGSRRRQLAVGLENQSEGFLQIAASFGERPSLGVHARDFFHVGDVPPVSLFDHRGKLACHRQSPRTV
jgi:hypothetical protein